ncbi:hypothetical protein U1Q18_023329 [Sarracenia purpurea var. burkii]
MEFSAGLEHFAKLLSYIANGVAVLSRGFRFDLHGPALVLISLLFFGVVVKGVAATNHLPYASSSVFSQLGARYLDFWSWSEAFGSMAHLVLLSIFLGVVTCSDFEMELS